MRIIELLIPTIKRSPMWNVQQAAESEIGIVLSPITRER
jgi:hypothetical protein